MAFIKVRKKRPAEGSTDFFALDINNLEVEWVQQPKLFHHHALQLADARELHEQSKAELELIKAELDLKIRRIATKKGDKLTEATVQSMIVVDSGYQDSLKAVSTARHTVDVLTAAVNALDHRKRALEKLVDLHGQNYFSVPSARGEARKALEEKVDASTFRMRKKDNHDDD